ncbi:MAG: DUF3052 family protein [Chloroflexi bacterium]|nr:DUF3052 family protein [Chloroflexota bacterium]
MTKTLAEKLYLKPGQRILVLDPPDGFLAALPAGAEILDSPADSLDVVQVFARSESDVHQLLPRFKPHVVSGGRLWLAYPKGSSKKYSAEINRDSIWAYAKTLGMDAVTLLAVDEDWSTMRIKLQE